MPMRSYILGEVAGISLGITSSTASTVGADPDALSWFLTEPNGATISYTWPPAVATALATTSAGGFRVRWLTRVEGRHYGGWLGSGTNAGADEFEFYVRERQWD